MFRKFLVSCLIQAALVSMAIAAGPYGGIRVGAWVGGAFTDDNTGAFSHCAATSAYGSGVSLVVGQNVGNAWLLSFASPSFHYNKGDALAIDVIFDGQSQARLFATANSPIMWTAILPANSSDESNDLALLQGPAASFKEFAKIRDRSIRSGDSVVAIGFPYHGLLTSDFTVTTGIVSSLSGLLNDTRVLQISAAVQPGNSGGPLLDTGGLIVGMVAAKINALKFVRATGNIPENINFAIKTGTIRDFLDNSVVPYQTAESKGELKTTEIAGAARSYTLLISCTATEQAESTKR